MTAPTYGLEEDGNGGMTDYHSYEKYISDYVKRQIEKQEPIITSATVAVTVNGIGVGAPLRVLGESLGDHLVVIHLDPGHNRHIPLAVAGLQDPQNTNVILNIPNDTRHVWDQAVIQESSASVTMTMKAGASLSPERVTAIKNLVAAGVPNMERVDLG